MSDSVILATERFTSPGSTPSQRLVLLHGILGRGANLRTLAKRFVTARPTWEAVTVDLRNHGASLNVDGADTLAAAARDLEETFRDGVPVRGILGHSYGGKVALEAHRAFTNLEHVFVVDSELGTRRDVSGDDHPVRVLERLEKISGPWSRREDFVAALETEGLPKALGQWLAMNLVFNNESYSFGPNLVRVRAMLDDYFTRDFWPMVETWKKSGPRLHFIVGNRSRVWRPQDITALAAVVARSEGAVTSDVLDAGHWVHVDAFEALLAVLLKEVEHLR